MGGAAGGGFSSRLGRRLSFLHRAHLARLHRSPTQEAVPGHKPQHLSPAPGGSFPACCSCPRSPPAFDLVTVGPLEPRAPSRLQAELQ